MRVNASPANTAQRRAGTEALRDCSRHVSTFSLPSRAALSCSSTTNLCPISVELALGKILRDTCRGERDYFDLRRRFFAGLLFHVPAVISRSSRKRGLRNVPCANTASTPTQEPFWCRGRGSWAWRSASRLLTASPQEAPPPLLLWGREGPTTVPELRGRAGPGARGLSGPRRRSFRGTSAEAVKQREDLSSIREHVPQRAKQEGRNTPVHFRPLETDLGCPGPSRIRPANRPAATSRQP
ncbi:hypothetical protein SKAU_G00390040 [Synaphobranchus kaupii]|uniref:Uncharacterized protein n=1 Tax=Synaphobranchus kaupii TaxID=118154 RepID=A0A9Q1EBE4_SYNKA|nr:hypothetical protein SKAU_G00390040 [Synaphobranchus kaupii]